MKWGLGVNWDRGKGGWMMECNAFFFAEASEILNRVLMKAA